MTMNTMILTRYAFTRLARIFLGILITVLTMTAFAADPNETKIQSSEPKAILPLDKVLISCEFKTQSQQPYKSVLVCASKFIKN